jgi:ferredoxin
MGSAIYWFSGTGNSLHAAEVIAETLGDCRLVPMARAVREGRIRPGENRVGLVFPMYFEGLPEIVERFCGRLEVSEDCYLFGVVTSGGGPAWAVHALRGELGGRLDAGFMLPMVGNYVPMYDVPDAEGVRKKLAKTTRRLEEVSEDIADRREAFSGDTPVLGWLLDKVLHPRWRRQVHVRDRNFGVTEACNSCGTCQSVCPVDNILLVDGAPVWHHLCQECMACLHWCPERAIEYGAKTGSRGRYTHPDVELQDMVAQSRPAGGRDPSEGIEG